MTEKYNPDIHEQIFGGTNWLHAEESIPYRVIKENHPEKNWQIKWNDASFGDLFSEAYRHNSLYCPEEKSWYSYNGQKWVRDEGSVLVSGRMKQFYRLLDIYCHDITDEDLQKNFKKFVAKMGDRYTRDRMLKDAQDGARVSISQFDTNPNLINMQNGTYDLEKEVVRPWDYQDYITMQTNCLHPIMNKFGEPLNSDYADYTRWQEFINEIMLGDEDMTAYLQRALGYSLLGSQPEEAMFIAYGKTTRNGKGTLLNTIHHLLGDYAKTAPAELITGRRVASASQANPMLASLRGARIVTMNESSDSDNLDEMTVKSLTGGDPISTRNLYSGQFEYTPEFKMWLSCNSLPNISDRTVFSSDRIKVIPFEKHFSAEERDVTLKRQFKGKLAKGAIMMWLTRGYALYRRHGFKEPDKVKNAVKQYEEMTDVVGVFLEDTTKIKKDGRVYRTDLYNNYKSWCRRSGYSPVSNRKFYEDMDGRFEQKTVQGTRYFVGLEFRR